MAKVDKLGNSPALAKYRDRNGADDVKVHFPVPGASIVKTAFPSASLPPAFKESTGERVSEDWASLKAIANDIGRFLIDAGHDQGRSMEMIHKSGFLPDNLRAYEALCVTIERDMTAYKEDLALLKSKFDFREGYAHTPEQFREFHYYYEKLISISTLMQATFQMATTEMTGYMLEVRQKAIAAEEAAKAAEGSFH